MRWACISSPYPASRRTDGDGDGHGDGHGDGLVMVHDRGRQVTGRGSQQRTKGKKLFKNKGSKGNSLS
jgi:hypothetical protein